MDLKFIYGGRLFVCFVCHVKISQDLGITAPLVKLFDTIGKPLMSSRGALRWLKHIMFQPTIEKLLNI
jgi:hypothetical protein